MLVGNKVDLEDERVVSKEEGEEMAKRCKSGFIEGKLLDSCCCCDCFSIISSVRQEQHQCE